MPPVPSRLVLLSGQARWVFGACNTPEVLMRRFVRRKNYIGQLELLAAVAVYFGSGA